MSLTRVTVAGWRNCGFFQKAVKVTAAVELLYPKKLQVTHIELADRDKYVTWLAEEKPKYNLTGGENHTSSPIVWLGDNEYLGGCDAVLDYVRNKFMGSQQEEKKTVGMVPDGVEMGAYDYDLVCIGGGSGGLALTKEAANLGAKVACLDFVKPSPHGTTWGLGGTCVNVGCIPKKLCHRAAILGEELAHDAKAFGWTTAGPAKHSWSTLQDNVHDFISSLNFKYRVALREKKVTYLNKLGKIVDAHTLELTDRKGKTSTITAGRIVVAVGGRPTDLSIPGGEHAINSDDIFQMDWTETENKEPGKTLVIGASYVALECAGFFAALGYDTSVMVRSILLRGFDREYSDKIGEYMEQTGTKFIRGTVPSKIEKLESGKYKVFWNEGKDSDEFDTVVTAIGRYADTPKLGLDSVGVKTASNGKIICENDNEQTNIPNIYAIGDVVQGMLELTPVAIQSGIMLARRLYGNSKELMDYSKIPTTVFTPIEYGCCGLSEEDAIANYGQDDLEVFHKELAPLEWELVNDKPKGIARAKLICLKSDNLRVVGLHILGPNCGEITQGFALAMKKGATYQDFQNTVGIHPTVAEDFTTLTVTKASGEDAGAAGC